MAEAIVIPGERVLGFIRPACMRSEFHKNIAAYQGIEPYLEYWTEDYQDDIDEQWLRGTGWIAVRRITDQQVFVADFFDRSTSPYFRNEDYIVDAFGGVEGWLVVEDELFLADVISTPDVEFKAARIVKSETSFKDYFYILEN